MAQRYAVAAGSWSAPSTWDGGATIPADGDEVYANGRAVVIDQDVTPKALRINADGGLGVAAGGKFVLSGSSGAAKITIKIAGGILPAHFVQANSTSSNWHRIISVEPGAPDWELIGDVTGSAYTYAVGIGVKLAANTSEMAGTVGETTIAGGVTGGSGSSSHGLYATGAATITCRDATGGSGSGAYGLYATGAATITCHDVIGGGNNSYGLCAAGAATITCHDVTGGGSGAYGLYATGAATITCHDVTGGSGGSSYGLLINHASAKVMASGTAQPGTGSNAHGVYAQAGKCFVDTLKGGANSYAAVGGTVGSPLTFRRAIAHTNGRSAFSSDFWAMYEGSGGPGDMEIVIRSDADWPAQSPYNFVSLSRYGENLPPESAVRRGFAYGPDNSLVGELTPAYPLGLTGPGVLSGTLKLYPDQPVADRVRLYTVHDGLLIAETTSDPQTGVYVFPSLPVGPAFTAVGDTRAGTSQAAAATMLYAQVPP